MCTRLPAIVEAMYRQLRPEKYGHIMDARSSAVLQYGTALSDDERERILAPVVAAARARGGGAGGGGHDSHTLLFVPRPRFPQAITREL
jgi:hypothetical protein